MTKATSNRHRLIANNKHSDKKYYFRDQITNNKADKFASLLHATFVNRDGFTKKYFIMPCCVQ